MLVVRTQFSIKFVLVVVEHCCKLVIFWWTCLKSYDYLDTSVGSTDLSKILNGVSKQKKKILGFLFFLDA